MILSKNSKERNQDDKNQTNNNTSQWCFERYLRKKKIDFFGKGCLRCQEKEGNRPIKKKH